MEEGLCVPKLSIGYTIVYTRVYHERLWYNLLISWALCWGERGPTLSAITSRFSERGLWDVISLQTLLRDRLQNYVVK